MNKSWKSWQQKLSACHMHTRTHTFSQQQGCPNSPLPLPNTDLLQCEFFLDAVHRYAFLYACCDGALPCSHLVCPPIAGPGAELCDSSCEGFYCLSKEFYCLPKSCISSQALLQIAVSDTNINCDLEKIFLGVTTCSGTTVNVKCHGMYYQREWDLL